MAERSLYIMFECASVIIQTLIVYQYINDFSEQNRSKTQIFCGYTLFCIGHLFLDAFFRQPLVLLVFTACGIFALELILHKVNITVKLYLPILFCIIAAASELIAVGIVSRLFGVDSESVVDFGAERAAGIVVAKLILIILLKLTKIIVKAKTDTFSFQELRLSLPLYICPIISLALTHYVYIIDITENERFNILTYLSLIALLYLNFIVFWYFDSVKAALDYFHRSEAAEARLELQTQYYTLLEKHQKETIALRHDMRKHMTLIKSLAAGGYDKISTEYIAELDSLIEPDTPLVQTPHPVISALLTTQKVNAREAGIEMITDVNLISDIKVSTVDLCVLIGNVLDNAVEACELLPPNVHKYIKVKIAQRDSKLLIYVENPFVPGKKKSNRNVNRGLGLKNVEKVVERCGGMIDSTQEGGIYIMRIIIP